MYTFLYFLVWLYAVTFLVALAAFCKLNDAPMTVRDLGYTVIWALVWPFFLASILMEGWWDTNVTPKLDRLLDIKLWK